MNPCAGRELLIQADLDGELDAAATAGLATHLEGCPECAAFQAALLALSRRLRAELPRETAPAALRDALSATLALPLAPQRQPRRRLAPVLTFGAGAALAAAVALIIVPRGEAVSDVVLAGHVRALQPGHLMDVVSTDQHTVKPWFNGRIDYAPPVKDLADAGFPLAGGRLDTNGLRPVAVLVYMRQRHVIDLYVWPDRNNAAVTSDARDGFNVLRWSEGGMTMRAISDVNAADLADFVQRWRARP